MKDYRPWLGIEYLQKTGEREESKKAPVLFLPKKYLTGNGLTQKMKCVPDGHSICHSTKSGQEIKLELI